MQKPLTYRSEKSRNQVVGHSRQHNSLGNLDILINTETSIFKTLKPVRTHTRNRSGGIVIKNDLKSPKLALQSAKVPHNRTLSGFRIKKVAAPLKNEI